jgi:hypothetical protein
MRPWRALALSAAFAVAVLLLLWITAAWLGGALSGSS